MKTLGAFTVISLPKLGLTDVVAKVDTGAYTGALHTTNMVEKMNRKGEKILEFYPAGKPEFKIRTKQYTKRRVRASNSLLEERYVIETKIEIQGKTYPISISLTDRSNMTKTLLIGRQFLRAHRFLVDVNKGTQYRYAVED